MKGQQSLILIETRFLSANLPYTKALGDLHHLLARRHVNIFLLIKLSQPEKLIFSKELMVLSQLLLCYIH